MGLFRQDAPDPPPVQIKLPSAPTTSAAAIALEARRLAAERSKPHLDWADDESKRAIDEHLKSLGVFFTDVKTRSPQFAEDVLSLGSKARLVADKLPFTRTDRHANYLRDRFGARLFTPDQLAKSVELVVKSYTASVQSTESVMLVKIKADVADLPSGSLPQFATKESLERAFATAIEEAAGKAQVNLGSDAFQLVVSEIAGTVLVQVAVKLGVSAGILGTGAATSWATFGVSVVAGFVIDYVVSWVWDWWSDPEGDLAKMMNEKLDHIHRLIVDGDGTNPGLRARLVEVHQKRTLVRRQAVGELIEGKVQP
jgi:hypothetical protein